MSGENMKIDSPWIRATVSNKRAKPVALHFRVSVKMEDFILERRVEDKIETLATTKDEVEFKRAIEEYANSLKVKKLLLSSFQDQMQV